MAWMLAIAGSVVGNIISANGQENAAQTAAQAQLQAAQLQANVSSNEYTANQVANLPTRELGGLAQQQEGYLLGLTPDLNISPDYSVANINPNLSGNGSVTWSGPGGGNTSGILNGYGGTGGVGTPGSASNPGTPGTVGQGSINPISGTPNNGVGSGTYGSLENPYNPSTFFNNPDYNFLMQQGTQALNRSEAAGGNGYSSGAIKDALGFASGLATTDYNQAFNNSLTAQAQQLNMLNAAATGGQVATAGNAAGGYATAGAVGSAATGAGNAQAASAVAGANAWTSAINGSTNTINSAVLAANNPNSPFYQGGGTSVGGNGFGTGTGIFNNNGSGLSIPAPENDVGTVAGLASS